MEPSKWWYLSELARHLELRPSSLQRPLAVLSAAGILARRREGNRIYFRPEDACPYRGDLQALIAKTAGIVEVLREALAPHRAQMKVAFVYGSVARSLERPGSDLDLMVVGQAGLAELSPALHDAERRIGRPVNASVYPPQEFRRKLEAGSHFLTSVLDKEKLYVVGTEHDLGEARSGGSRRTAHHQQEGARRPARRVRKKSA
ncbi:MAG: hypothetical protein E6K80_06860 [Candidatus Eisenbacteria bacterium]|uniref:Polymerase nucleotidyl transferase domain-containing protein n=1 Tax=Eiseniibacteriota bacterium TaxID=2212470 RepID=A0A538U513_UNCEI|nr:MAG: hypothetical protein E6K80_06860 [Candidatus Eisenbacteria bacterium]